jgi:alanyl-tRNA synthetase
MTRRLFWEDPYLLEFDARVVARRAHGGRPAVVLDRTAFYAESGGQPWDTGRLDDVGVNAVIEDGDAILHILDAPLEADFVHGRVDAERRRDHRQQHHGQHLLSRAFVEEARARTVSFHLGEQDSSIDLDRDVTEAEARSAERRANEVVWEARAVSVRIVTRAEAAMLEVTVPEEAGETVRLVEAAGFDLQACGGTHPRSTSEVGLVLILGRERYKGGARVRFACGYRALAVMRARLEALDATSAQLSVGPDGAPAAVERLKAQLVAGERRARDLLERALEGEAQRLLAAATGSPRLVSASYEGWDPAELRALALKLIASTPCIVLLGSRADKAHVVFAQSEGLSYDVPGLLRDAVATLGGRGGGRGNLAQGGGDRPERLSDALAAATAAVRRRP